MSIKVYDKQVLVNFGKRLKAIRLAKGLSQQDLANEVDIELSQIYRLETAKTNPTLSTLAAVAKGLNMNLSELFKGVELD